MPAARHRRYGGLPFSNSFETPGRVARLSHTSLSVRPRACSWRLNYFILSSVFSAPAFTSCPAVLVPFLTACPVLVACPVSLAALSTPLDTSCAQRTAPLRHTAVRTASNFCLIFASPILRVLVVGVWNIPREKANFPLVHLSR